MDEFRYQWEWVAIWYSPLVEVTIVLHWSQFTILLLDEEEATCVG